MRRVDGVRNQALAFTVKAVRRNKEDNSKRCVSKIRGSIQIDTARQGRTPR